jgi:hypothetical protein
VLETTRSSSFLPGANLVGQGGLASWQLALPTLDLTEVVCLGRPEPATLHALARLARRVTVCDHAHVLSRSAPGPIQPRLPNVTTLPWEEKEPALGGIRADLVVVTPDWARVAMAVNGTPSLAQRILKPGGHIYWETREEPAPAARADRDDAPRRSAPVGLSLRLLPDSGEVNAIVPYHDPEALAFLAARGFVRQPKKRGRLGRLWPRRVARPGRHGWIAGGTALAVASAPPRYVCEVAASCGIDIEGCRWALVAPGTYASRKAVFFLFSSDSALPRDVVKVTRAAEMNRRLRNERDALERLAPLGLVGVPRVRFAGSHAGLEILGQSALDGAPFRASTEGRPDCPHASRALRFLTELGARTLADPAPGARLAESLEPLFARFVELYRPHPGTQRFLREQIETLAGLSLDIPSVFQHGDPGLWNLLVANDGGIAFLDWEAAEPAGVPLWDLFYFYRSFCMQSVRVRGRWARMSALSRRLLDSGPLQAVLGRAIAVYRERVPVPTEAVLPLFHTCWMHRALKEATRLPANHLHAGHYVGLLLRGIEQQRRGRLCPLVMP